MIIDYASRPPAPEFDQSTVSHLANYRRVYAASEGRVAEAAGTGTMDDYLAMYDRVGARHVVVKARDVESTFGWRIRNEDVAAFCRTRGDRFIGFAGVDPHKGMTAVRELEYAVRALGLKGLNLQCFEHRIAINDPRMYPLYAKCIELDIPVNIHAGINFSSMSLMEYGRPMLLDQVMVHFPELRVCAAPPGFPWIQELIGVAWRHPNVHIGLVAVRPRYLKVDHSGYEPLLQYGRTLLQDRIIFGSSYPLTPVQSSLDDIDALGLEPAIRHKWLFQNACNFLRLPGADAAPDAERRQRA
ncbi:MAG: amidohydrolase [Burkholderiales bacterium]|nr:amidohydrolase [Burkholderiales bacterium]MCE7876128.1 amidohydrolase [Betaproteobacteria bacterium PRO3]